MSAVSRERIESQVQETWRRLLNVKSVRPDDDFYQLGGHSRLAARMLVDVGEALGVTPELRRFDGRTTLSQVADTFWEIARRKPG